MSKCISLDGEYSDHVFEGETFGSEFICSRCFAFDEDAAQAEIDRLREQIARGFARVRADIRAEVLMYGSLDASELFALAARYTPEWAAVFDDGQQQGELNA